MMMIDRSGPFRNLKAGYDLKARYGPYMLSLWALLYREGLIAIFSVYGSLLGFFSYFGSPYSFRNRSVVWPRKGIPIWYLNVPENVCFLLRRTTT